MPGSSRDSFPPFPRRSIRRCRGLDVACSTSAHTGIGRERVEFHKRFQQAADAISEINLRSLLQRKQEGKEPEKG